MINEAIAKLSQYWSKIQGSPFPWLEEELDPLTKKQRAEAKNSAPKKRGRPKKGEEKPSPEPKRIEKQKAMTLDEP